MDLTEELKNYSDLDPETEDDSEIDFKNHNDDRYDENIKRTRSNDMRNLSQNERILSNSYLITLTLKQAVAAGSPMTFTLESKNPLAMVLPASDIDANFYNTASS